MRGTRVLKNLLVMAALGAGAAAVTLYLRRPLVQRLDAVKVACGPMMVVVEEQGETRARDPFVIAAPVEGEVRRLQLREGDRVQAGQVVAFLRPSPLPILPRTENRARVAAAESTVRETEARLQQAARELDLARTELARMEKLARSGDVPQKNLDVARSGESVARQQVAAARARLDAAHHEVAALRATGLAVDPPPSAAVAVRSPVSGRVLSILQQSERVIPAGTPLLTLGDSSDLEVVIDVLSSDAVKIRKGGRVILDQWGGEQPLEARVRKIEPQAFTKISALGVEEKRVHVIADFLSRPEELGVGYRVEAKVVVWSGDRILKIPSSAAFRRGNEWAVFRIDDGRTAIQTVSIGRRNDSEVEILSGLQEGSIVVRRPERDLEPGVHAEPSF
ncbi:MAG: efflux RND transporter periplasmic adaptor subunit [Bryobacterales bacterium]|nr:efflux RND transporter periplasmic adaptor subunit [Bryobacterales bacterium]